MGYVKDACIVVLLSAYIHLADIQQTAAYQIYVMVPNFSENEVATVVCKVNNSELNTVNCPKTVPPFTRLRIILSNDPPSTPDLTGTDMCDFSSFLTCTHDPPVSALECGCYHDGGDIYTVNVTVRANRTEHENKTIDCRPDCLNGNFLYGLVNTITGVPIVIVKTTTFSVTTETTTPPCKNCSCTDNCPPSAKCPDWCIAVSVCVSVGGVGIITITVIIIKKKKEKLPGCRPTPPPDGNNRTEVPTINTKAEVGNNWTELTTTTAPGGNNRTELKTTTAPGGNNRTELNAHL